MIPFLSHSNSLLEEILLNSCFLVWEDFARSSAVVKPQTQEFRKEAAPQVVAQLAFMEVPQKMVTSQDILHLRSPIWQGLGSLKASKRNTSWMFLIRPFLWRGGWRPWDLRHEFHQSPTSSFTSIAKQWNWHKLRRASAVQGWVTQGRAPGHQAPAQAGPWKNSNPIPKPLLKKWEAHAEWGHRAALTAGTENQRAAARNEGKTGFFLCTHKQWLLAKNKEPHVWQQGTLKYGTC